MRRNESRRSMGTVLMGVGLLLILSVAGYFAWTEVQASQVRNELEQGAAAAAARATRVAQELAPASPASTEARPGANSAETAAASRVAPSARPRSILPANASTPAPVATASAASASTLGSSAQAALSDAGARAPIPSAPAVPTDAPASSPPAVAPVLPVRLAIPDLKIDTKVIEMGWQTKQTKNGPVSEWVIPKNVAGHHLNSAALGQGENLVISGHNNILGRVFMPISQAWNNDRRKKVDNVTDRSDVLDGREVVLYDAAGKKYTYVITDFFRLKDTGVSAQQRIANGRYILPTGDERVTIVTCWPPTNNTHRLVLIARPEK